MERIFNDIRSYPGVYLLSLFLTVILALQWMNSQFTELLVFHPLSLHPENVFPEAYRILTFYLGHESLTHLLGNVSLLIVFGRITTEIYGELHTLATIVFGSIVAALGVATLQVLDIYCHPIDACNPMIGISAGIFALIGMATINPWRRLTCPDCKRTLTQYYRHLFEAWATMEHREVIDPLDAVYLWSLALFLFSLGGLIYDGSHAAHTFGWLFGFTTAFTVELLAIELRGEPVAIELPDI